jgi:hypothetical protein
VLDTELIELVSDADDAGREREREGGREGERERERDTRLSALSPRTLVASGLIHR